MSPKTDRMGTYVQMMVEFNQFLFRSSKLKALENVAADNLQIRFFRNGEVD